MKTENQYKDISKQSKNNIKQIEHSWLIEGYQLTDEDKQMLENIAMKKSSASVEVQKMLKKYQSGGEEC